MSEPEGPDACHTDVFGFDEVWEFDVEMIPDQEGIDAVIAWAAAKNAAEADNAGAGNKKQNDPDRPAA